MKAAVYFTNLRTSAKKNLSQKISELLDAAGMKESIPPGALVAVKVHFGEKGNTAFIRPHLLRDIIEKIAACNAKPFLTDANTLYRGERTDAVSHLLLARRHGFSESVTGAPVIIADGLRGLDAVAVPVNGKHFSTVSIAAAVHHADSYISIAHVKGHELTGFGGALKNTGMGCASRDGKMKQHCGIAPRIERKMCIGCGTCAEHCPAAAIVLEQKKALIHGAKCIGCASCILVCPREAVKIRWDEDANRFMEKMIEYTVGVLTPKKGKTFFINFLTDISPACDCYGHADFPIVPDIGILASKDPVAVDQASVDCINACKGLEASTLKSHHEPGQDKFRGLYPQINWEHQLEYAVRLGLGTRDYRMIEV
ncbi:MAG: DUF362 domain-containing protein [Desulfobacterota bacterium]|nr:DUF362 domain-containing protein [Thermodesulfobacteriota bacterium]